MSNLPHRPEGRVLFADDDELFQQGLSELLGRQNLECVCVATTDAAVAELKSGGCDALIADINMPGNEQLELVDRLPGIAPGVQAVLLTGNPTVETAARSVRLPVAAYMTKPPNVGELGAILHQLVAERRVSQLLRAQRNRIEQWDQELKEIERQARALHSPGSPVGGVHVLSLTLRHLILTLSDLEKSSALLLQHDTPAQLDQVNLVSAIRHTVTVLERTRQNFKSRELGELRQNLERLLADHKSP